MQSMALRLKVTKYELVIFYVFPVYGRGNNEA